MVIEAANIIATYNLNERTSREYMLCECGEETDIILGDVAETIKCSYCYKVYNVPITKTYTA